MAVSKSHVTRREAEAVLAFAEKVRDQLGLPAWRFAVLEEPAGDDALASIDTVSGRWIAELRLCEGWMKLPTDERRNTIVHEVCHLLHVGVNHVIEDAQHLMHDHEWETLNAQYHRATEYMVDHLAGFLDAHYQLQEAWDTAHQR